MCLCGIIYQGTKITFMHFVLRYAYRTPTASCSVFSLREKGMQVSFSTVTQEKNIKNFSSGQAREINKPQGYHMYPSRTYGSKLL